MKDYVSDPALLEQLNGQQQAQKSYIEDPALLAQLNGEGATNTNQAPAPSEMSRNYVSDPSLLAALEGNNPQEADIQPPELSPFEQRLKALEAEEQQYQTVFDDYQNQLGQVNSAGFSGAWSQAKAPKTPVRDLATLRQDWELGVKWLRPEEFSSIVHELEQGFIKGSDARELVEQLSPGLNPEAARLLELSRLTGEALEGQRGVSTHLTTDEARKQDVFRRGVYDALSFGYAYAPDEENLNSDDLQVAAAERALQLIRKEEAENLPLQNFLGQAAGTLIPFGAGVAGLRAMRTAQGLAPVGAGVKGAVVEGATVGGAMGFARRPEGAENMDIGPEPFRAYPKCADRSRRGSGV